MADGEAEAWGDVAGDELDPELALKARLEEMEQFRKHGVYRGVKEDVCWAVTDKGLIGARWIDVDKGGEDCPGHRSRRVGQKMSISQRRRTFLPLHRRWRRKGYCLQWLLQNARGT